MRGASVCRAHGAAAPQVKAAAARRIAEAQAQQSAAQVYLRHAGQAPDNPLEALKALAARFHAVEADLFARMAREPEQMAVLLPAWGASAAKYLDVLTGWLRVEPPAPSSVRTIADLLNVPDPEPIEEHWPARRAPVPRSEADPMPEPAELAAAQDGRDNAPESTPWQAVNDAEEEA